MQAFTQMAERGTNRSLLIVGYHVSFSPLPFPTLLYKAVMLQREI